MVKYDTILKIIEEEVRKCWTKAEIREKLAKLSDEEKDEKIKELVTPLQYEVYHDWIDRRKEFKDMIERWSGEEADFWKRDIRMVKKDIEYCDEIIFNVERKLYEKQKPIPEISNPSEQYDYDEAINLENKQIEKQENIEYSLNEVKSLKSYFGMGYTTLNSYLYGYGEYNMYDSKKQGKLKPQLDAQGRHMSNALKKTGAVEAMTVYRGGLYDPSKGLGDIISFKGFASCSFSETTGYSFATARNIRQQCKVKYKILLPENYPCISANGKVNGSSLAQFHLERELLLNKNFKGQIVDITGDVVTIQAI